MKLKKSGLMIISILSEELPQHYEMSEIVPVRSSHIFFKKGVFKKFAIFTRKHLRWSPTFSSGYFNIFTISSFGSLRSAFLTSTDWFCPVYQKPHPMGSTNHSRAIFLHYP